jgi:hypothetical protein
MRRGSPKEEAKEILKGEIDASQVEISVTIRQGGPEVPRGAWPVLAVRVSHDERRSEGSQVSMPTGSVQARAAQGSVPSS